MNRRRLTAVTAAGAVTCLFLAACSGSTDTPSMDTAEGYPVSVTNCGTTTSFEGPPERVLLGWANMMTTMQALEVEDAVIGYVAGGTSRLPDDAPKVDEVSPDWAANREVVIAAEPDLFLLNDQGQIADGSGGVTESDLSAIGASSFVLGGYCAEGEKPDTIDMVYDDVQTLGNIFGVPDKAREVVSDLQVRVAAAKSPTAYKTAFVQVFEGKLYALGGSVYNAVLSAAGLENDLAGVTDSFAEITPEEVLVLNPEAIVIAYDDMSGDPNADIEEVKQLLSNSTAVRENRVAAVASTEVSASGVSLIDVVEELGAAFHSQ